MPIQKNNLQYLTSPADVFKKFAKIFKKPLIFCKSCDIIPNTVFEYADVAELADALASGASGSNVVWVQVPSSAPVRLSRLLAVYNEVWLSLVERCVRDAEAVGSSPVTSTRAESVNTQFTDFFFALN